MPQDAFTLKYLCRELNEKFCKGKINKVIQPSDDEIVFTVYNGKTVDKLLLDVNPSSPRMGIIEVEKESPLTAPNFCMLLRKHLLSAEVNKIELVGFDRIVKITCTQTAEFKDREEKILFVELMGRYSNIILTEKGKVLGSNRGINMIYNGVRPLIMGKPYVFPPVQDKKIPSDISLVQCFENYDGEISLPQFFCDKIQGVALSTAQEIITLFSEKYGQFSSDKAQDFYRFFNQFLYGEKANPCVVFKDGKVKDVCVFPYKNIDGEKVFFDTLYLAEDYYYKQKKSVKEFNDKRSRLLSKLNTAIKKYKKKYSSFLSKEKEALSYEENRIKGELILSNIYRIKQGESSVILENYYDNNNSILIELDERLSPSKNAENYYKKYTKQKRTAEALIPQKEQVEKEIEYLTSIVDEVDSAENLEDLKMISKEMREYGLIDDRFHIQKKKKEEEPFRVYVIEDFVVKVGRNNLENDKLLAVSKPHDLWIHAKEYHSSHVIIQTEKAIVSDSVVQASAEICAYYSKGRGAGKVEIAYTQRKNVKKPSKSKPGFVIYENFKTMLVEPKKHDEKLKTV